MQIRRALALAAVLTLTLSGSSAIAQKNDKGQPQPPKRSKAEQQEIDTLVGIVDGVVGAGKTAPSDIPLTWEVHHFMRNAEGGTMFPFVIDVDRKQLASPAVTIYIAVVDKDQEPIPAPAAADPKAKNDKDKAPAAPVARPIYAWENLYFANVPDDGKFSRVIGLKPGKYEVFFALKEKDSGDKKKVAKAGLVRKEITVPDLSNGLATSDVIIASQIIELQAPATPQQQAENPYIIGPLRLVPTNSRNFGKSAELNIVFWVYGATIPAGGKPDVLLEYNFHQKLAEGEKFFNKTQPQPLNAQTLPPNFDPAQGHQLTGIQSVPLMSFPAGEYRLEIKVTDKASGKAVTQNVNFAVTPS